jgi:probable phosphoglycerate mutase
MTEFLIIRHGQTPWNVDRRIQGWRDIELNDTGHQQARRLAHYLSQTTSPYQPVHAVYSSDLLRAQQTAQALAQALSVPLALIEAMRERNYGILEGVAFDQMAQLHPEVARVWQSRDPEGIIPGGETLKTFHARVTQALETLAREHQNQRVAVVTHGGAMDIIWRAATATPIQEPRKAVLLNASVNRIGIRATDTGFDWSLIEWGNIEHLQDSDNDLAV